MMMVIDMIIGTTMLIVDCGENWLADR